MSIQKKTTRVVTEKLLKQRKKPSSKALPTSKKQAPNTTKQRHPLVSPLALSASGRSNSLVDLICGSITMPCAFPTERWSSEFSQKKSAIASPFSIVTADFGSAAGSDPQLATVENLAFLFRSAERNSIIYSQNHNGSQKAYQGTAMPGGGGVPTQSPAYLMQATVPRTVLFTRFDSEGDYAPHGPILFPGSATGSTGRFVWCDLGDSFFVTLTSPVGIVGNITGDYYGPNGLTPAFTEVAFSLAATFPQTFYLKNGDAQPAGYYSMGLETTTGNTTVTVSNIFIQGIGSSFAHQPVPNLASNYQSCGGLRLLGSSLMYTNTAAMLQLGGTISMVQSDLNDEWLDYVNTTSVLPFISKQPDSRTMNCDHGMYGFLKPMDTTDFNYQTHIRVGSGGQIIDSSYPIDAQGSFLALAINVPTLAGSAGYFTVSNSVEYLTEDVWRGTDFARATPSDYQKALEKIKAIEQFHENPLHWGEIWSAIKTGASKVANAVVDYGPTALKIASMFI